MALEGVFAVLPLLFMIGIGYAIAEKPWYGRAGMSMLSKLNMNILLPVYMVSNVTKMYTHRGDLLELLYNLPYPAVVIGCAMGAATAAGYALRLRPPQRGVFINGVGLSNVVVMGLPVMVSLIGDRALPVVMLYYACNTTIWWTVGVWMLRREASGRAPRGAWATLREAVTTPPLLGFLLGILWVLSGIPVPVVLERAMAGIGNSVTLMSMIFIGSVIRFADFRNAGKFRNLRVVFAYKLLACPVIAGFVCWALPVPLLMKQVFFILSNMPAMAQLPIMSKELDTDYEFASLTTALTTTVSMASVPVYIFLMEYSGIFAG